MSNKWDWNKALPAWLWHQIALDGFPSWEKPDGKMPASVLLTIKNKTDQSSHSIAIEVDDWCKGAFYYRDFTDDGIPFVDDGEVYRARFSFQFVEDAKAFLVRYGGEGENFFPPMKTNPWGRPIPNRPPSNPGAAEGDKG